MLLSIFPSRTNEYLEQTGEEVTFVLDIHFRKDYLAGDVYSGLQSNGDGLTSMVVLLYSLLTSRSRTDEICKRNNFREGFKQGERTHFILHENRLQTFFEVK